MAEGVSTKAEARSSTTPVPAVALGGMAEGVLGDADETTGHLAHVIGLGGHERGMGPPEAQRHAESLRRTDGDVGAELGRRALDNVLHGVHE